MTRRRTNKYLRYLTATLWISFLFAIYFGVKIGSSPVSFIDPISAHASYNIYPTPTPTYLPPEADVLVAKYAQRYGSTPSEVNHIKVLLHCLLFRETGYGSNKGHGDNGKAGGPLQFHQPTWDSYRKIMQQRGLVTEIGSRYDMAQAIETTAWAISDGRAKAWGPVLRGECR